MKLAYKKSIIVCILAIVLIDGVIAYLLFKSRSFPRLAMWNIIESGRYEDFYWQPEDAPAYFHFEPVDDNLVIFRKEIYPLVKDEHDMLKKIIKTVRYMKDIFTFQRADSGYFEWDSPKEMLEQIRGDKRGAHCFHYSILFSTYLSSIGIKSRLWALEGDDGPGRLSHTVAEVYIEDLKRWVVMDVTRGIYFSINDYPISVLELRDNLLRGKYSKVSVHSISDKINNQKALLNSYTQLLKCTFLRTGNDFVKKYDARIRYGIFSRFQRYLDKFPSDIRRGLDYLLGRRDILIHYVDGFDKSLKLKEITAKSFFYFFIISPLLIFILFLLIFLKPCLMMNLSMKDTRHR